MAYPPNFRQIRLSDSVKIEWYEGQSRYYHVLLDGMVIALCPSQETAITVGRALRLTYTLERTREWK